MAALTPQQIRDQIDGRLATLWPVVVQKQQQFFASHQRYFQGLRSCTFTPADGQDLAPDNLAAHPYYQGDSWQTMGSFPSTEMSVIECHQYDGPAGRGFVLILTVILGGRTWQKAVQVGPETWRSVPWQDATPS